MRLATVCILAAGMGTRVNAFGGLLHKALLPIGPKPVLTRIIEQFDAESRFVVAVGHRQDQIRTYLALAHPDRDIDLVDVDPFSGPGAGPGRSLWECRSKLTEPFVLTAADTLTERIPTLGSRSWMGIAQVEDPTKWCTVTIDSEGSVSSLQSGIFWMK